MVTIEQKLSLFSSFLHRTMDESFEQEMGKLKKEYEIKAQKSREQADKEAEKIINAARKRADAQRTERISRSRVELKKEYMSLKEKYFSVLMERIEKELDMFVLSEQYSGYMLKLVRRLEEQASDEDALEIYLTARDSEKYVDMIRQTISAVKRAEMIFKLANDDIIGGLIAENTKRDIRMDMSLKALLDDNRPYIMQTLFQAIETGE